MTEQEFDAQLQHIEEQAAAMQERVDGYRDQSLAKLFVRSEWSQEELAAHLAAKWGREVSRQWVEKHLRFGHFLTFFATDCSKDHAPGAHFILPNNLTEGAFRKLWEATKGEEEHHVSWWTTKAGFAERDRRFGLIVEELQGVGLTRKRKPVQKAICKVLAGKRGFVSVETMRELIAPLLPGLTTDRDVCNAVTSIKPTAEQPYRVEKATSKTGQVGYRLVKTHPHSKERLEKWRRDLVPLLKDLIAEARKEHVMVSQVALCELATRIERVLNEGLVDVSED